MGIHAVALSHSWKQTLTPVPYLEYCVLIWKSYAGSLILRVYGALSSVSIPAPYTLMLLSTLLECGLVLNQRGTAGKLWHHVVIHTYIYICDYFGFFLWSLIALWRKEPLKCGTSSPILSSQHFWARFIYVCGYRLFNESSSMLHALHAG